MAKALYINWNESHNLGIPIIDEQHRAIVSTINSLHYYIELGKGFEAVIPVLRIMEQYSILHFDTEETLMKKADYPDSAKHFITHQQLAEKVRLKDNADALYKDPEAALKVLKDWWINHINIEDRKYVKWLKNI